MVNVFVSWGNFLLCSIEELIVLYFATRINTCSCFCRSNRITSLINALLNDILSFWNDTYDCGVGIGHKQQVSVLVVYHQCLVISDQDNIGFVQPLNDKGFMLSAEVC